MSWRRLGCRFARRARDVARGEDLVQTIVTSRYAAFHTRLEHRLAGFLRRVVYSLCHRRLSRLLGALVAIPGVAGIPRLVELLGVDHPLPVVAVAKNAAHSHLLAVVVLAPDITVFAADTQIDFTHRHRPAIRTE